MVFCRKARQNGIDFAVDVKLRVQIFRLDIRKFAAKPDCLPEGAGGDFSKARAMILSSKI